MKNLMLLSFMALLSITSVAQPTNPQLLGVCSLEELKKEPYAEWFITNYTAYVPNESVVKQLKNMRLKDYSVTIFFATWCGDSKREVPRFIKLLDVLGFQPSALNLIAVDSADSLYKQSPGHEERGKHIYKVPTFIISKKGNEVNRIVEIPALSLERDLLAILTDNKEYRPNYPSYVYLSKWFDEGILTDDNVSLPGLANQLRGLTRSANELNTFGRTLLSSNPDHRKAVLAVYQINCYLYPDSWQTHSRFAELLLNAGEYLRAEEVLHHAIEVNNDPENVEQLLKLYNAARDKTHTH
ncbi:MAG: thioredoxin family protein [Tannerellaceae bacterium]|jgi:thiol-disulfide isomerase/thioredoxin|nr:thioredoxin family protein [Tannerellaceae bacterium]